MAESDGQERVNDSEKLAEDRTDLAEDRTVMAAERTFAGWLRTAFAAIGVGLAFNVMFGKFDPPWLARAIATIFIALGAVVAFDAQRRVTRTLKRLSCHKVASPDYPNFRWMSLAVVLGAATLIAALWIFDTR